METQSAESQYLNRNAQIAYHNELARKAVHVCSIAIPIIYYNVTRELALFLLALLFVGFFAVDLIKMFVKPVAHWYYRLFGAMLRPHELDQTRKRFNGATFVTLSALLAVWLFPKMIAIASITVLVVADTAAALIGLKFGKHKLFTKTVEGSAAFFVSALLVVALTPNFNFIVGIGFALLATWVELYPLKIFGFEIDDNLTIPLISGAFAYLCYLLFLPDKISSLL
jgi:dolichol kinase